MGYTIVEMAVVIVIVSILAATFGMFVVKLLTLQEQDREEAYIREKLVDICGIYADFLSIGSSFSTGTNLLSQGQTTVVKYRRETGGVSLETGVVTRVAYLESSLNLTNRVLDLGIHVFEPKEVYTSTRLPDLTRLDFLRTINGNASLMPLVGDVVSCTLTPVNATVSEEDADFVGTETTDAALGYLQITARYPIKNHDGEVVTNTATAGRVVRLWNHE